MILLDDIISAAAVAAATTITVFVVENVLVGIRDAVEELVIE